MASLVLEMGNKKLTNPPRIKALAGNPLAS